MVLCNLTQKQKGILSLIGAFCLHFVKNNNIYNIFLY